MTNRNSAVVKQVGPDTRHASADLRPPDPKLEAAHAKAVGRSAGLAACEPDADSSNANTSMQFHDGGNACVPRRFIAALSLTASWDGV